jgi:hypothetical protein
LVQLELQEPLEQLLVLVQQRRRLQQPQLV